MSSMGRVRPNAGIHCPELNVWKAGATWTFEPKNRLGPATLIIYGSHRPAALVCTGISSMFRLTILVITIAIAPYRQRT